MSDFYQRQRIPDNEMDEEMARQYYSNMGYPVGSPNIMPQLSPIIPGATGYVPTEPGYPLPYQNPYSEMLPSHSTAQMPGYHPSSYHGYMPQTMAHGSTPLPLQRGGATAMAMHHQHQDYNRPYPKNAAVQRPGSPSDTGDLEEYGIQEPDGTWRCRYPSCSSKSVFTRACDLRKHFNRHNKYLFCRYDGCPQATEGGFSSKKDLARHEAKHNPQIPCEWEDCDRVFSRMDNMKDHMRRIHYRGSR
jgi:Zinc finger, C2H2 type